MADMTAKEAQFAAVQSDAAVQKHKLQEQLDSVLAQQAQQNEELRTIVQESHSALTQLRGDKAWLSL